MLLKLIDAAKHLSPRDRLRLLTGVLLVVALIVIVAVGDHIPERVIVLYALVSATLVMIVGKEKDGGIRQAALILTFALVFLVGQRVDRLLEARTVTNPVAGRPQRHLVSGKVVDQSGGRPLADVSVRARGDGESTQTDSLGHFRLGVLESSIQGGVVEFQLVQGSRADVVSHPVSDAEITLVFRDRVAQVEPGGTTRPPGGAAAVPLLLVGRPADTGARRQGGVLAVIVDSIHTLNDGTGLSRSEWSFDVKVTDAPPIHVSKAVYSERAPDRLMLVGSETDVPASDGDTIRVTVNGVREVFFWKYRVKGSVPVAYAAVPADRPLRREVLVQGNQIWDGQFRFFLTVLRLPGRPAPG
ncbi:MAG: hypothetical protein ACJ8GN_14940 [Longimicrobiaceae bacterium]